MRWRRGEVGSEKREGCVKVWRKAKERGVSRCQESSPVLGSGSSIHASLLIATHQSPTTTGSPRRAPVGFPDFSGPIYSPPHSLFVPGTRQDSSIDKIQKLKSRSGTVLAPKEAFSDYCH